MQFRARELSARARGLCIIMLLLYIHINHTQCTYILQCIEFAHPHFPKSPNLFIGQKLPKISRTCPSNCRSSVHTHIYAPPGTHTVTYCSPILESATVTACRSRLDAQEAGGTTDVMSSIMPPTAVGWPWHTHTAAPHARRARPRPRQPAAGRPCRSSTVFLVSGR